MPSFPGGDAALQQYLSKNIKYPVVAEENGVQGRVIVTFVVERDGSITDVKVVKSVDPSLDKEATRVVKSMPHWIPGKQNGSAVRVKYTVPVTFKLQ
jgi:protein TonB